MSLQEINNEKFDDFQKGDFQVFISTNLKKKIKIVNGLIENHTDECIVNAAQETLMGGGGIDGTIHQLAGDELNKYIANHFSVKSDGSRIHTGEAIVTPGFDSNYKSIIHTVAPYYNKSGCMQPNEMQKCFDNIFDIVKKHNIKNLTITPIGTGFYGYHMLEFTVICFKNIASNLTQNNNIETITLITNDELQFKYYMYFFDHYLKSI